MYRGIILVENKALEKMGKKVEDEERSLPLSTLLESGFREEILIGSALAAESRSSRRRSTEVYLTLHLYTSEASCRYHREDLTPHKCIHVRYFLHYCEGVSEADR